MGLGAGGQCGGVEGEREGGKEDLQKRALSRRWPQVGANQCSPAVGEGFLSLLPFLVK